jgi:hypothetical protein
MNIQTRSKERNTEPTRHCLDNRRNSETLACEHCGRKFNPRQGSGGRPQRFCSTGCRLAFHAEARSGANGGEGSDLDAQRSQRGPTCSTLPALIDAPPTEKPASAPEANSDFDWNDPETVTLQEQPATAIYFNPVGVLVIRQRRAWDQDEDAFVYISPENVGVFLDKITDVCGVPTVGAP